MIPALAGAVLSLFGGIGLVVVAFQEDTICGVMFLFLPFYMLYFIITRFRECWQLALMEMQTGSRSLRAAEE